MTTNESPNTLPKPAAEHVTAKAEGVDWDLTQWTDWIRNWLTMRMGTFVNDPDVMISLFNGEQKTVHEYHGRELLELLQNADDAGVDFGPNRALIELSHDGLCVANTGLSFSTAGVRSLMISDRSPKQLDRNRYVGNRGLGFRSILNWTNSPIIFSGRLQLRYSPDHATKQLEAVCAKSPNAQRLVSEQMNVGISCPIPTLSCPMIHDGEIPANSLLTRAVGLRNQGYDTVIVLPFTKAKAYEQVAGQIANLFKSQELMLFLQNIEQLDIRTETESHVWRVKRESDIVRVLVDKNAAVPIVWRIFSRRGNIPEEFLDERTQQTPGFEIKIAVPKQAGIGSVLYNYFPTKIAFPYPVVAHATMDLTANRDHLEHSATNKFLVTQLASLLAEAAEGSQSAKDIWQPLRQITKNNGDLDLTLKEYGFEAALVSESKTKKLIPRRDNSIGIAATARQLPADTRNWLPQTEFEDLVCWSDNYYLQRTLDSLQVPQMTTDEFRNRLNRISPGLSLKERTNLIAGLVRNASAYIPTNPIPELLTQADGTLIEAQAVAYIPSTEQQNFTLPAWLTLRFVAGGLVDALITELKISRKELATKLWSLNLREYDFGELASAISTRVKKRCEQEGVDQGIARLEGLHALKGLFESIPPGSAPNRRYDLHVQVLTRKGEWKQANELYLGESYPDGSLMEALLGASHPEKFVASSDALGSAEDVGKWQALLRWLGAAVLPKACPIMLTGDTRQKFIKFALRVLKRPMAFGEYSVGTGQDIDAWASGLSGIEYLEEMLRAADPHAILAWVASDPRMDQWRVEGDRGAKMTAVFRTATYRDLSNQALPSFVLWQLRESTWLPTVPDGRKHKPIECAHVRIPNEEIRKMFPRPAVESGNPLLKRLGIDGESFRLALSRTGVCMNLDELPWEHCYAVLLRLPESDPQGEAAMPFYRMLAEKEEDVDLDDVRTRKEFQQKGKLWTRLGGQWAYRPVSQNIFFATDATIPTPVLNAFPTIDLPKRRGTEKLQRVFCIQALRATDISIEVIGHELIARTDVLNDAVEKLKPFALAIRLAANPDATGTQRLKKLKVFACASVDAVARLGTNEISIHIDKDGESLICGETAYLITKGVEPETPLDDPVTADTVANILASILQVDHTNEFARIATARHSAREQVLSLILQHDGGEALRVARKTLQVSEEDEIQAQTRLVPPSTPPPNPIVVPAASTPSATAQPPLPPPQPSLPAGVSSQQLDHTPTPPPGTIAFRVHSARTGYGILLTDRRVTDGARCEQVTLLHETGQGRFPFPVGSMQGDHAFGCDVISFATEADRSEFQAMLRQGTISNLEKAVRFIEVKGRGTASGPIALEGNQLQEARRRKERYFIYRVYEAVEGEEWRIAALENPLTYDWPVSYKVDPAQRAETEFWAVRAIDVNHDTIA